MSNFDFLSAHSQSLAALGLAAEKIFPHDPPSCVAKLRLLTEAIAKDVGHRIGLQLLQPTQAELLRAIDSRLGLDPQLRQMFHLLRRRGNDAVHEVGAVIGYREALESLKVAREVALWFHRTFGANPQFKPGPFQLPDDPSQKLYALQKQIEALNVRLSSEQALVSDREAMAKLLQQQADQERSQVPAIAAQNFFDLLSSRQQSLTVQVNREGLRTIAADTGVDGQHLGYQALGLAVDDDFAAVFTVRAYA